MIRHWHARGSILVSRPLFPSAGQPELIRPGGLGGFNWWKMVKLSGYGSIPINTSGGLTSINPSYFDVNKRGTRFWPIPGDFWLIWDENDENFVAMPNDFHFVMGMEWSHQPRHVCQWVALKTRRFWTPVTVVCYYLVVWWLTQTIHQFGFIYPL